MVQFCYLRLYIKTETVSCPLLLRIGQGWTWIMVKKLGQLFQVLMLCCKSHQKVLRQLFPDEICLTSPSELNRSILWMSKGTT